MKIPKPPEGDATAKRLHDDCIDAKARLEKTKNTRGRPCTLNDNAWMISCLDTYLGYIAKIKAKTENENKETPSLVYAWDAKLVDFVGLK